MNLNKVVIDNFRNINHAEYDLKKLNIFTGPNAKGKTNTILAIYWALADYLMDGSSDYASFKPHSDSSAEISVELLFDDFKLKKTFAENWVPTRGSNEVKMEGHETKYYIDDIKYPTIRESKKLLFEKLGTSTNIAGKSSVDIIRAIIDPYYLAQTIAWKDLRTFIIDLVGDVDDELVLSLNPAYSIVTNDLAKYKYNVSTLTNLYKQQIKLTADEIKKQQNILVGYAAIKDVDATDLGKAEVNITLIDNDIADLRIRKQTDINPKVAELEKKHSQLQVDYVESATADRDELERLNASTNDQIKKLNEELDVSKSTLRDLQDKAYQASSLINQTKQKLSLKEAERDAKAKQKEDLLKDWELLDNTEYQESLTSNKCPQCGFVLNQDDIDRAYDSWLKNKNHRLDDIVARGKKIAGEVDNLDFEIADLKKSVDTPVEDYNVSINKQHLLVTDIETKIHEAKGQLKIAYMSEKTVKLVNDGKAVKAQLEQEQLVKTSEDIDLQISDKEASKQPYTAVIADHNAYLAVLKKAKEVEKTISLNQESQVAYESKLMALEDFIRTKLSMLKSNVAKVFGKLEFILVESNIKEGSYQEVCYPLIIGQSTPFISGSGAEKIITGVYIIECVKRSLSLPDLPIIFDEIDKLDTQTIASKLTTNSQIISTKVDDINYERVTLVSK